MDLEKIMIIILLHAEFIESQLAELDESKPIIYTESDSDNVLVSNRRWQNDYHTHWIFQIGHITHPRFDGKAENLKVFIDSLTLVDSPKESH